MNSVDPPPANEIREALASVRARIVAACSTAGRDPNEVRLVAIGKTRPAASISAAFEAGQRLFGENRVQEALEKQSQVDAAAEWHLVGHLQRNKARHAVGAFALIHGVDDERLLRELDRRASTGGLRQAILLQVRLGAEPTKSGVAPERLAPLVDAALDCAHLELRGLMTIPPPTEDPDRSRAWFGQLRDLRDAEARRSGHELPELSMGMTADFEAAIAEGATLIRVGRAIFGERGGI